MSSETSQRLFFALWPPDGVRERLDALARVHAPGNSRRMRGDKLHITLAFVGSVDADTRACLEAAAGEVRLEPFSLDLDRVGVWPKPRIQWLAPAVVPEALRALAADLERVLLPCGYTPEARAFRPHVTLARKVNGRPPVAEVDAIRWAVRDFVLVRSVTDQAGPRYEVMRRWPAPEGGSAAG